MAGKKKEKKGEKKKEEKKFFSLMNVYISSSARGHTYKGSVTHYTTHYLQEVGFMVLLHVKSLF